ncbi:MAG: hypothetical protein K2I64_05265 [Muribaculaceae bacterium]|nr:hypothetical protein [Muribaculaceae bacterium]
MDLNIPASKANHIDSITPRLPDCGLYITPDIRRALSIFAGGVRLDDNTISKTNEGNVDELRKYIPVNYGHWGGYWWFTSFPMITSIKCANNLIVIYRRTTWCNGDEIWYIKENGQFLQEPEPINSWIE